MIKLINYLPYGVTKAEYISKSCIHSMSSLNDGFTSICMNGGYSLTARETPEEILAMPDIEATEKVIDWEQRRYEIAKDIMAAIYTRPDVKKSTLLNISQTINVADALISELKKGQDNEN